MYVCIVRLYVFYGQFMTSLSDALFNKTKQKVLGILFSQPERKLHLREIARIANVTPSTIQKELYILTNAGILEKNKQGNQLLYKPNKECPVYDELVSFSRKSFGISDLIRQVLQNIIGIKLAFIYGSIARVEEKSKSDVDVLLIGDVNYGEAISSLLSIEYQIGRPINAKVFKEEEIKNKILENNSFIHDVINNKKIFLIGNENDFEKIKFG